MNAKKTRSGSGDPPSSGSSPRPRRWARHLSLGLLLLALMFSCEDPIAEFVTLTVYGDGSLGVRYEVHVNKSPSEGGGTPYDRRFNQFERELIAGETPWHHRLDSLEPELTEAGREQRRRRGRIRRYERWVRTPALEEGLARLFADTPIVADYQGARWSGDRATLTLVATGGDNASREVRQLVGRRMRDFSQLLAEYYVRWAELYDRVAREPELQFLLLQATDDDLNDEAETEIEALFEPVSQQRDLLLEEINLREGEEYSLQELSRRVFDPFPAQLLIELPAEPEEVVGFEFDDGTLRPRPLSLWDAFSRLRDSWLANDPLLDDEADVDALLETFRTPQESAPRAPTAAEVRRALLDELAPIPEYRVSWPGEPTDS